MATSQTQTSQIALIRKMLSELPAASDYAPVAEAIGRSTELGEMEIANSLSGLVSMPQSTMVFANPVSHTAKVDCNGTNIELKIRSFSIRGLVGESEIVAGNIRPSHLIFVGLFGRLPQRTSLIDEESLFQSLIDKKFYQIMEGKKKSTEQKIILMKANAINDIKNIAIKISIEAAENLIKNSIDKNKLENLYKKSLYEAKSALKQIKA